jgi:CBS domain-containing protein
MTADPLTVKENTSTEEAIRVLARQHITGLPVVDQDGKVIGIVSEVDLFSKKGNTVGEVMTREVISVSSDTSVEIVSHLLTDHRIRRLPVIDKDRLVGIVTRADIIRMLALHWHCEVCGEVIRGEQAPASCPKCGAKGSFVHASPFPGA